MARITQLLFESDKILSSLSPHELELFMGYSKKMYFEKGKLIFYEGGIATGIFLLEKGKAKIYKTGLYGKDQIFYIYKSEDLFGYHALLADEPYEDSCEALEDCIVSFISKDSLEKLLKEITSLKRLFIQNMSHEFGVLVNTITILAQKNLRERFALYLLILQERYYDMETNESIINLPREDLANIIGTARESLGRLLKDFREEGLINVDKRIITIANEYQLRKIANL